MSLESQYSPNATITFKNKVKYLDPTFRSIGNLKDDRGTLSLNNDVSLSISPKNNISFHHEKKEKKNDINQRVRSEDDFVSNAGLSIFDIDTTHKIRYHTLDVTGNVSEKDTQTTAYNTALSIGPQSLKTKLSGSLSQQIEDVTSTTNRTDSFLSGYGIDTYYEPQNPWFINHIFFNPYYNSAKTEVDHIQPTKDIQNIIENIGINSKASIINGLDSSLDFEKKTVQNGTSTHNIIDNYYNYSSLTDYIPFRWLTTSYSINHKESISPIPGRKDRIEDIYSSRITNFEPYFGLKHVQAPSWVSHPFFGSRMTYSHTRTLREEIFTSNDSDPLKLFSQTQQRVSLLDLEPFTSTKLNNLSIEKTDSNSVNNQKLNNQLQALSSVDYLKLMGQAQVNPVIPLLQPFSYSWDFQDSESKTISTTEFDTGTKNTTTRRLVEDTQTHVLSHTLPKFNFGPLHLTNPRSSVTLKWLEKVDESTTKSNDNSLNNDVLDNSRLDGLIYTTGFSPYSLFDFDAKYTDQTEYYNRNKALNTANNGSLFKDIDDVGVKTRVRPFSFLTISNELENNKLKQYSNTAINISQSNIVSSYSTFLNLNEDKKSVEALLTPITLISLKGKYDVKAFNQTFDNTSSITTDILKQEKTTSGLIIHLFNGLDISYDISTKQLHQNNAGIRSGFENKWAIKYKPINYKNFNVNIDISKTTNLGFGFNDIQRDILLSSSGQVLNIEITERDDAVLLGSLSINIDVPLSNFKHLERLKIEGVGYVKNITDKITPSNEFDLSGLLFKTSILL